MKTGENIVLISVGNPLNGSHVMSVPTHPYERRMTIAHNRMRVV